MLFVLFRFFEYFLTPRLFNDILRNIELVSKLSESYKFPELSYACKQLVAHEISLVKMKRFEVRLYQNSEPQADGFGSQEIAESRTQTGASFSQCSTPKGKLI